MKPAVMNEIKMNTNKDDTKQSVENSFQFLVRERGYTMMNWQETNFNWVLEYRGSKLIIEIQIDIRDPFVFVLLSDPDDTAIASELKYLHGKKIYLQQALLKLVPKIGDKNIQHLGGKWENVKQISEILRRNLGENIDELENSKAEILNKS